MKTVTYIGDPNDNFSGPMKLTVKGKTYTKGQETLVTEEREKHLRGHNHFETESGPWPEPDVEDENDEAVETSTELDPADHSDEECRAILVDRAVTVPKKANHEQLVQLVMDNGGFPRKTD